MTKTQVAILPLILATVACSIFMGGPAYPETPIAVSTEAIGSLQDQIHAAETAAVNSGTLTLTINESQITSLIANKLDGESDSLITDPQVYLRDGQIQIYAKAIQGNLQANIRVVLTATLNESGRPVISVVSTDFGPLPVPEELNNAISKMVDEAFAGAIGPVVTGFRLESITIADGIMTLTGRIK